MHQEEPDEDCRFCGCWRCKCFQTPCCREKPLTKKPNASCRNQRDETETLEPKLLETDTLYQKPCALLRVDQESTRGFEAKRSSVKYSHLATPVRFIDRKTSPGLTKVCSLSGTGKVRGFVLTLARDGGKRRICDELSQGTCCMIGLSVEAYTVLGRRGSSEEVSHPIATWTVSGSFSTTGEATSGYPQNVGRTIGQEEVYCILVDWCSSPPRVHNKSDTVISGISEQRARAHTPDTVEMFGLLSPYCVSWIIAATSGILSACQRTLP